MLEREASFDGNAMHHRLGSREVQLRHCMVDNDHLLICCRVRRTESFALSFVFIRAV